MNYSYTKGIVKGVVSGLTVLAAIVTFAGFSDMTVWSLLEQYVRPALASITVGGLIAFSINWIKHNFLK